MIPGGIPSEGMVGREAGYLSDAFSEAMKNAPTLNVPKNPNLYGLEANQLTDNRAKGGKIKKPLNLVDIYKSKKR